MRMPALWCHARWASWVGVGLISCVALPEFDPAQEVHGPRVLAMVAEPPEARLGEDIRLSVMVAEAEVQAVRWRFCPAFYVSTGFTMQYDEGLDASGACPNDPNRSTTVTLEGGEEITLPGALTLGTVAENREAFVERILGLDLPGDVAEELETRLGEVGIPFMAEATIETTGRTLRASKRVLLTTRAETHSNPPPPWLIIGGQEVVYYDGFRCAARDGGVLRLPAGEQLEVEPRFIGVEEPWLESYQVLDARGELAERTESAFYTFYSTSGGFKQRVTQGPLRNNLFRVPASGCHTIWVVVQDGHGGTSACAVKFVARDTANGVDTATCDSLVEPDAGVEQPFSADGGTSLTPAMDAGMAVDAGMAADAAAQP